MKKLLSVILALLIAVAVPARPVVPDIDLLARSVVALQHESGKIYCSGFVIKKDTVQTAYHCLMATDGTLKVDGGPAEILYADRLMDSAVLAVKTGTRKPLRAAANRPLPGEDVWAMGHAVGLKKVTTMQAKVLDKDNHDRKYIVTEPKVIPGMSGGPVLNASGEVVGMNHMSYGQGYHELDYALDIVPLKKRVEGLWER